MKIKTKIITPLIALSILGSNAAFATNGYFSHGYSAKEKGMAGTGVAKGGDSLTTANNPANLLHVGDRMDVGVSFFMPIRSYEVTGGPSLPAGFTPVIGGFPGCAQPGVQPCQIPFSINNQQIDSGREFFVIPSFGYSKRVDEKMVWGIALYGNGGMNTSYSGGSARIFDPNTNTIVDAPGTFGAGSTGVDLSQLFINTTVAYQASDTLALGASLIVAVQRFSAKGLAPFANVSLNPTKLTNNGPDMSYGLGFKLGADFDLSDSLTVGVSYQSKMSMSKFKDYAGLFAEGGDFDIPSTYTLGFAWKTSKTSTLLVDYQRINYTDVASISNPISPLLTGGCVDALNNTLFAGNVPSPASGSGCLGGANGAGFGWDDVDVIKVGYEWSVGNNTFRLGYSTNGQPIASTEVNFNLLAPGVVEDHYTGGYTLKDGENEWTVFLMYAPNVSVSGISSFDPAQTISFKMHQFEFGLDYKF